MAMIEGVITIDPLTGAVLVKTGLAGEVFDVLEANQDYGQFTGPNLAKARNGVAVMARAVAKVVPHIIAHAQVQTSIGPADAGLQVSAAPGSPTAPPPIIRVLTIPGSVT